MFKPNDCYRFIALSPRPNGANTDYRSEYSRDYARVLHSPSFRRLQNKTQLFPSQESDFFRNRLTHSLEVSQIAKSIALKLKSENPELNIIPEVCEIAGLVHDIGHPPFGHNGESALDECMLHSGGFEGNAQTLRILTRLEKKEQPSTILDSNNQDNRVGLNLTARVIASALKYDSKIPISRSEDIGLSKGYYQSESNIVEKVKQCLVEDPTKFKGSFKTIECSIMDIADDIAYSTYDVEDAFKANFLSPYDMLAADDYIFEQVSLKLQKDNIKASADECRRALLGVFADVWYKPINEQRSVINDDDFDIKTINNFLVSYRNSKRLASNGYYRTQLTSGLVNSFINGVRVEVNSSCPIMSKIYLEEETLLRVNILKHFTYVSLINSSMLKVAENRGNEIVKKMFNRLFSEGGYVLLPEDTKKIFYLSSDNIWRARVICDFIAGMTDRYALEFYGRLFSENPQTIFKPL